ncbi:histone deacetylase complex subunit SAP30 isoform X1 [Echinops telfairi]|uniref:Histone deacetylase complex subunit SAP30 isoform X1 n=2 Tax=Echinops telfairi TaxID=9371 RepID=A0AC55CSS4_ECHTE|nr:histone deacetylase complex subunit SAP30 isoform X1 [Echinops telfairi]XP_045142540.1 histone deacetylase complex subunit SAP30 isoform X1 [Echinops telfairi]
MPRPKISVGPLNQVPIIAPQARPTLAQPPPTTSGQTTLPLNTAKISNLDIPKMEEKPALKTLDVMFSFLNHTNPNVTSDCCLCLNPEPPFYVGIAANASFGSSDRDIKNLSNADHCGWGKEPKLTLGDISGQGLCITAFSTSTSPQRSVYRDICQTYVHPSNKSNQWFQAPNGTWWACTNGITPCAYAPSLTNNLCILTHIVPQVYYYSGEGGREHLNLDSRHLLGRFKRVPVLVPVLLARGVAGATAIGSTALVKGADFTSLSLQVNHDLQALEKSVTALETSLSSLAEVVLQNRRGLDLLFLKQGGLCMALGEACCFYVNHSGVIREGMSQLRKRLQDRENALTSQENWYQRMFSASPWLTSLLSTIAGPLILLILTLTVGPCVLNAFLKLNQKPLTRR